MPFLEIDFFRRRQSCRCSALRGLVRLRDTPAPFGDVANRGRPCVPGLFWSPSGHYHCRGRHCAAGRHPVGVSEIAGLNRLVPLQALAAVVSACSCWSSSFRSVADDSRWNVKPFCLGLAGAFVPLSLFRCPVVQSHREDAQHAKGFVAASVVPLLALSTTRSRDWASKSASPSGRPFIPQRCWFRNLLAVHGRGRLLRSLISGGEWGRALQIALGFVAVMASAFLPFRVRCGPNAGARRQTLL